jgi:hypothetical protein
MLLYPIFQLASTTDSFKVLLYQFDGVSINVRDKRRKEAIIKSIQDEVGKVADRLGIPTKLEIKH